jgi:hypothetical protein
MRPDPMGDTIPEKRKEERTPTAGMMISVSVRPEGEEEESLGLVVDKSANGFQFSCFREIAPDTIVFLSVTDHLKSSPGGSQDFIAKTRWCKKNTLVGGFGVGVEILGFASKE